MTRLAAATGVVATFMLMMLFCSFTADAQNPKAEIDWMVQAFGDGRHNAFTDLALWKGQYYLCFRNGEAHGSMDGEIRVMRSADLKNWEPCGTLNTYGDDRDPHFVCTDNTLMVYFGVWDLIHGTGHNTPDRNVVRSHTASSTDGVTWSKVQGVYEPGFWLWRVTPYKGAFYSAAYTARRPKPDSRETRLLRSSDGLNWDLVSLVTNEHMCGEADIWFQPDDSMWLVTRANDKSGNSYLYRSDPTLTKWSGESLGTMIHSPVWAHWRNRHFISGRGKQAEKQSVTRIWEWKDGRVEEVITLPSGGDTSYSGLVVDPATLEAEAPALFVSWYSQHEREPNATNNMANVYVARVTLKP